MTYSVEHLFTYIYQPYVFYDEMSIQILLNQMACFTVEFLRVLCIMWIMSPLPACALEIFSLSLWLGLSILSTVSFTEQSIKNFNEDQLINFIFLVLYLRNYFQIQGSLDFLF